MKREQFSFWDGAVVYQIYPRSFHETREKPIGEGNLAGITAKLDYLSDLGINAIWLSPFYPSPMADGGYDVADYTNIDPRYGNLEDFDKLAAAAHERDIKLMVDLVVNHTSDQHAWFQESKQSRDNPKHDWYIWRDAKSDGSPPNNWASVFSLPQKLARAAGKLQLADDELTPPLSAWEWNKTRKQYYLHSFAKEQPDLNWTSPEVQHAIQDVMRFWLNRGVDGFRVDAANHIGKHLDLPDEAHNPDYIEGIDNPYDQLKREHSANYLPTLEPYLKVMTDVLTEYPGRDPRIIFEAYTSLPVIHAIDNVAPKYASSFNFARLDDLWQAPRQKALLNAYHRRLPEGYIPNQVNGNHDKPRLASRIGEQAARAAAVINLTLPGMAFIYNGEEGGFTDVEVAPELQDDVLEGRDPARTPMLWNKGKNAGFSGAEKTWLPVSPRKKQENLADQNDDPHSSLSLYKSLLQLRNESPILQHGSYHGLRIDQEDALAFGRRFENDQTITVANFAKHPLTVRLADAQQNLGHIIISSTCKRGGEEVDFEKGIWLDAEEAAVIISSN